MLVCCLLFVGVPGIVFGGVLWGKEGVVRHKEQEEEGKRTAFGSLPPPGNCKLDLE